MSTYSRLISTSEGLSVIPASAAGLIALLDEAHRQELPNDRYVVVLTGRR
jgi:threonine synthase